MKIDGFGEHPPEHHRRHQRARGTSELGQEHRALVLVRNSVMIGLGLAHPTPAMDVDEMTMYQTLLMRAAALVLCDNLGIDRPSASEAIGAEPDRAITPADDVESQASEHARRLHRLAQARRTLMGELFSRLPRPLEPA